MISEIEQARLAQLKAQINSGQRSEFPKDSRLEFARRLRDKLLREEFNVPDQAEEDIAAIKAAKAHLEQAREEMPLLEHAEDIRARIEARAKHDDRARKKGLPVTKLGMQMEVERNFEKEMINLGIVVGTNRGNEDGTVSISSLLIKRDQTGELVETQQIEAKILRGGKFFIKQNVVDFRKERHDKDKNTYSVVYPRPNRLESDIDTIVADEEKARILLQQLEFLVDSCLTQPNLSFYRQKDISRRGALLK